MKKWYCLHCKKTVKGEVCGTCAKEATDNVHPDTVRRIASAARTYVSCDECHQLLAYVAVTEAKLERLQRLEIYAQDMREALIEIRNLAGDVVIDLELVGRQKT